MPEPKQTLVGWDTLPVSANARYPEIGLDAALLANAARVLLASEPYRFRDRDVAAIRKLLAPEAHCRVQLIDGAMTSWYGSRAIKGLAYLKDFRFAAA